MISNSTNDSLINWIVVWILTHPILLVNYVEPLYQFEFVGGETGIKTAEAKNKIMVSFHGSRDRTFVLVKPSSIQVVWKGTQWLHNTGNYFIIQGLYSLSCKTSYRQISWSHEAARLGVIIIVALWNLTGISAALLPRCLSNFKAIGKV